MIDVNKAVRQFLVKIGDVQQKYPSGSFDSPTTMGERSSGRPTEFSGEPLNRFAKLSTRASLVVLALVACARYRPRPISMADPHRVLITNELVAGCRSLGRITIGPQAGSYDQQLDQIQRGTAERGGNVFGFQGEGPEHEDGVNGTAYDCRACRAGCDARGYPRIPVLTVRPGGCGSLGRIEAPFWPEWGPDGGLEGMVPKLPATYERLRTLAKEAGGDAVVLLAIEGHPIFTAKAEVVSCWP